MKTMVPGADPITKPSLGVWDAVSIVVGIVIGVGIHETAPAIFGMVHSPWGAILFWVLGGILSFIGALCFAELATSIPRAGGDYHYLKESFGSWAGYLFAWMSLSILKPASIGMIVFIFASYAGKLFGVEGTTPVFVPLAAAAGLSLVNIAGVALGTRTQNVLTILKLAGFAGIIISGLFFGKEPIASPPDHGPTSEWPMIGLIMVFILYAYGGWNDAALVTSEIRNPQKNLPRALLIGVVIITLVYVLTNLAYLRGLGFENAAGAEGIAAEVLKLSLGGIGYKGMCLLIMVSALGAANGMIFTGARIYTALGKDYRIFAAMARRHPKTGTPVTALITEGLITMALIALVGSEAGRSLINSCLGVLGIGAREWAGHGGFETLLSATAPIFWILFFMTGLSVFVLRLRFPELPRPFRVPVYPLPPFLFCATSAFMVYRSSSYAIDEKLTVIGLLPLAIGIILYAFQRKNTTGAP